jgi:enoyl-CoA hydratase/carnithine racemase
MSDDLGPFGRPHSSYAEYSTRYEHVVMSRDDGILEMRLHTDGGPLAWGDGPHSELGHCFHDVGSDPENRVIILTGTGDGFIDRMDRSWVRPMTPGLWGRLYFNGARLLNALLAIEAPVISAVNGPARVHAELAVLADIVVASETAMFQDAPHFRHGTVPGDGVQLVWPYLLGPNRGRVFLLTGQRISAREALDLGVVAAVTSPEELMPRARSYAAELARQPTAILRYTRAALNHQLRRMMLDTTAAGLAFEGLGAHATWPSE